MKNIGMCRTQIELFGGPIDAFKLIASFLCLEKEPDLITMDSLANRNWRLSGFNFICSSYIQAQILTELCIFSRLFDLVIAK